MTSLVATMAAVLALALVSFGCMHFDRGHGSAPPARQVWKPAPQGLDEVAAGTIPKNGLISRRPAVLAILRSALQDIGLRVDQNALKTAAVPLGPQDVVAAAFQL